MSHTEGCRRDTPLPAVGSAPSAPVRRSSARTVAPRKKASRPVVRQSVEGTSLSQTQELTLEDLEEDVIDTLSRWTPQANHIFVPQVDDEESTFIPFTVDRVCVDPIGHSRRPAPPGKSSRYPMSPGRTTGVELDPLLTDVYHSARMWVDRRWHGYPALVMPRPIHNFQPVLLIYTPGEPLAAVFVYIIMEPSQSTAYRPPSDHSDSD